MDILDLPASAKVLSGPIPLIIVEGFLGGVGKVVWGSFEDHLNLDCRVTGQKRREVRFASVGPVSSLHDRACELYFAITGGIVDYGAVHSETHSHSRYGRYIPMDSALDPSWSRQHPLHFLGHSIGGPTILKLQYLLSVGHFDDPNAHPDMILSVNTISAPFRGTQLVYILGESEQAAPAVRALSIGSVIAKSVHLVSFLDPFMPRLFDLRSESRGLALNIASLVKQLWRSDWAEGRDATPFDVTFQASDERESRGEGLCCEGTYYRSQVACLDQNSNTWSAAAPLHLSAWLMRTFDFSRLHPKPSFLQVDVDVEQGSAVDVSPDSAFSRENDGIVPAFSQFHPLSCRSTNCRHYAWPLEDKTPPPIRGQWQVYEARGTHHFSFLSGWFASNLQESYWKDVGAWLRVIDSARNT